MADRVQCKHCGGSGEMALPAVLQRTLDLLRSKGPMTSGDVHRKMGRGEHLTAATNRLKKLEKMRLVSHRKPKMGNAWLYYAV